MPPPPGFDTRLGRLGFRGLLLAVMTVATLTPIVMGLLASFLIDDLDLSRARLGLVLAAISLLAAALSPLSGLLTDRLGGKNSVILSFATGAASLLVLAVSGTYAILFVVALLAAFSQASGNPASNKLIALHIVEGRRGIITGIKQSGVQVGAFLGGLLIPLGAVTVGWRPSLVLAAALPIAAVPLSAWLIPGDRPQQTRHEPRGKLPRAVYRLGVYGFLLGFGGSSVFFVPLFVEEALGSTPQVGGATAATIGLTAVVGRIAWARRAESIASFGIPLAQIAALSVVASLLLLGSDLWASPLLWAGAVVMGASSMSWNSVGMLAVMARAGWARTGGGSGVVMLGFLTGLGIGPAVFGYAVDAADSYAPMWLLTIAAYVTALVTTLRWVRESEAAEPGRFASPPP